MPRVQEAGDPDQRQTRTTPVRAGAQASRRGLVQAAITLWRANGFDSTTVTDICRAAGVSKALFYVYFSRREDVLHEAEIFAMTDAHRAAEQLATGQYQLVDLVSVVIDTLARQMRRYPPDLIFECVMESYRLERSAIAEGSDDAGLGFLFRSPFELARRDGKLRSDVDLTRCARIAQTLASDAIRRWASSGRRDVSFVDLAAADIVEALSFARPARSRSAGPRPR